MMTDKWEKALYRIRMRCDGRRFTREVSGIIKDGFGIHPTGASEEGWNITHLASGWNCFTAADEKGAKILAQYLTEHYRSDFERLQVSGEAVENLSPLMDKITADAELTRLRKLLTTADGSPGAKGRQPAHSIKIIW